jgi:DNA-binding transcriptional regulator PaaX
MFRALGKQSLDLHELFEAGGNDPEARTAVFDAVERLVGVGLLQEEGNDFYSLTEKGREVCESNSKRGTLDEADRKRAFHWRIPS